jgi:hypothetical protein
MTPLHVVFVPIPVAGQTVNKRAPPPQYPSKRRETWPLSQQIPQEEARRTLDDAKRSIAMRRDELARFARSRP